jgi:hypothetical protein
LRRKSSRISDFRPKVPKAKTPRPTTTAAAGPSTTAAAGPKRQLPTAAKSALPVHPKKLLFVATRFQVRGRVANFWVMVYFGPFYEKYGNSQIFGQFLRKQLCFNFDKKWIGLISGRFYLKPIWSPWSEAPFANCASETA